MQQQQTKLAVKRVSQVVSHGIEEPLIFDLREQNIEGSSVRAIQFFNMAAEDHSGDEMKVHAIRENDEELYDDFKFTGGVQKIIVDSGSDATILPSSFLNVGRNTKERALRLQDAQGEEIHIKGVKDVCFVFETENGRLVEVCEKAHFADGVSQPIISFGRLTESGWSIDGESHSLVFGRGGEVKIPVSLQNKSLVVNGRIRAIQEVPHSVRMLEVRMEKDLEDRAASESEMGWQLSDGAWIGVHLAKHYQDPQFVKGIDQSDDSWKRTTFVKLKGKWHLVEMNEPIMGLEDQSAPIDEVTENTLVVTVLVRGVRNPEDGGFKVEDDQLSRPIEPLEVKTLSWIVTRQPEE